MLRFYLKGFEFNKNTSLSSILKQEYAIDTEVGSISIPQFYPKEHLMIPEYATMCVLVLRVLLSMR